MRVRNYYVSIPIMTQQNKEYILCAAIWYKELEKKPKYKDLTMMLPVNCDVGLVFCGHRHPHCLYTMCAVTGLRSVTNAEDGVGEHIQGFLTNKNRFVDRKEGWVIADEAKQIIDYSYGGSVTLYSENLY